MTAQQQLTQQLTLTLRAPYGRVAAPLSDAALARIRRRLEEAAEALVEREERRARREAHGPQVLVP